MLSRENRDTKARKTQRDRKAKLLLERKTSAWCDLSAEICRYFGTVIAQELTATLI